MSEKDSIENFVLSEHLNPNVRDYAVDRNNFRVSATPAGVAIRLGFLAKELLEYEIGAKLFQVELPDKSFQNLILSPKEFTVAYFVKYNTYHIGNKGRIKLSEETGGKSYVETFLNQFRNLAGFYSQEADVQRSITDMFFDDEVLKQNLHEFAQLNYSDPTINNGRTLGAANLDLHSADNENSHANLLALDHQKGIKDTRTAEVQVGQNKREIFAAALVAKFLSIIGTFIGDEDDVASFIRDRHHEKKDEDKLYDLAKRAYEYMQSKPETNDLFERNELFPNDAHLFVARVKKSLGLSDDRN